MPTITSTCVGDSLPQHNIVRKKGPTKQNVIDMAGQHFSHVGDRHKCLLFGGCSGQTQIPALPAKCVRLATYCNYW